LDLLGEFVIWYRNATEVTFQRDCDFHKANFKYKTKEDNNLCLYRVAYTLLRSSLASSTTYNIYVTNKTNAIEHLLVRLRSEKLGEADLYSQKKVATAAEGNALREQEERLFSTLTRAGFCMLQPGIPKAFHVVNYDVPMYVSVHDGVNLLITDMLVSPSEFGCLTIKGDEHRMYIESSNPKPVWLACKQGDPLPDHVMKAKKIDSSKKMYFGRSQGTICFVDTNDGLCDSWISMFDGKYNKHLSGDLLKDTGYGIVQAKRGDFLPPNALQVDGVYVGRNHGDYLCPIKVRDGKVRDFLSIFKMKCKRGEIVVMTDDPL